VLACNHVKGPGAAECHTLTACVEWLALRGEWERLGRHDAFSSNARRRRTIDAFDV